MKDKQRDCSLTKMAMEEETATIKEGKKKQLKRQKFPLTEYMLNSSLEGQQALA